MQHLVYRVHCGHSGWLQPVTDGRSSGEIYRKYHIQGFQLQLPPGMGEIRAQAWHSASGWSDPVGAGGLCGTTGQSLPLGGFRISLTKSADYSVFYRAYTDSGWSSWHADGADLLTEKGFYALQIATGARGGQPCAQAPDLESLGQHYGTDKSQFAHDYLNFYESLFSPLRNEVFVLAEAGILKGASLRMWRDYFPYARLVGLDLEPSAIRLPNTRIVRGDATDVYLLTETLASERPLIFIEDASHLYSHQIRTFEAIFPLLLPGGYYVCEDIQTSYGSYRNKAYNDQPLDAATYFTRLAMLAVNSGKPEHPALAGVTPELINLSRHVDFIVFRRDCALIKKKATWPM